MTAESITLKSCPFCGAYPVLLCDLRDWRGHPVFGKENGLRRCIRYELSANHKQECYIRHINGANETGKVSAFNWEFLVETWNNRMGGTSNAD